MKKRNSLGLAGAITLIALLALCTLGGCSAGDDLAPAEPVGKATQALTCNCASIPETCNQDTDCAYYTCDPCCGPNCTECTAHYQPFNTNCNDGNVCTLNDYCDGQGTCKPGTGTPNCNDNNACTQDGCDPNFGGCHNVPLPNANCDDGNPCTTQDKCNSGGACQGGVAPNCADTNPCTVDSCDPTGGANPCKHVPSVGSACNDNNQCTTGEKCDSAGACTGGIAANCNDNNPCTNDSCNAASGCTYVNNDGASCSDNNICTTNDKCSGGGCAGGLAVSCDDNNPCTTDSCNATSGCQHVNVGNGVGCDDGNACSTGDQCTNGICAGTGGVNCNDNNPCTKNTCASNVCSYPPEGNGTPCDDGDTCTVSDSCTNSKCAGTATVNCDDNNPCTTDSCDPKTGCAHTNADGTLCKDTDPCTVDDACAGGKCVGKAMVCTSIDECHDPGTCTAGACDSPIKKDGSACTGGKCTNGVCIIAADGGVGGSGGTDGGVGGSTDGGGAGGTGGSGASGTGATGSGGKAGATGKDGGKGETFEADPAGCKCRVAGSSKADPRDWSLIAGSLCALGISRIRRRFRPQVVVRRRSS